jgi:hypothetical protein
MNPYTGGYDLCLEASEDVLSAFVRAVVGGQELFIPVQVASVTGLAHLLIERAELAIDPSREASALVAISFRDSSVQLALPSSIGPVRPLAGELTVGVPFSLSPVINDPDLGDVRGIQVDLTLPANPDDPDLPNSIASGTGLGGLRSGRCAGSPPVRPRRCVRSPSMSPPTPPRYSCWISCWHPPVSVSPPRHR